VRTGNVVNRNRRRDALLAFGVLALVVAAGLARMGWWQLDRAVEKQLLLDGVARAAAMPPVAFADLRHDSGERRFRAVRVAGRFSADRQVLLDNQLRDGQPGVRVYVPLKLADDSRALLVDRGWLAWPDRSQPAPTASVPEGWLQFDGVLLDPPGAGLRLGAAVGDGWPLLVTRIDLTEIERHLGQPLLDLVLEDRATPRAQSIRAQMLPPERHRGYALQWFGLSLTVLIIYCVLAWRTLRAPRADQPQSTQ
jgi:cytochrome oxidase assembly protein ShyY1